MRVLFLGFLLFQLGVCIAGQFDVAEVLLTPCTKTNYRQEKIWLGLNIRTPEVIQAPQKAHVSVIIDGAGVDDPNNRKVLNECINEASKQIGIMVIASDTIGSSSIFKEKLVDCIQSKTTSIRLSSVFLKSETICSWSH
jgi:hypothetical protein